MQATAIRIPLKELEDAQFVKVEEQYVPSYAITRSGLKVSRASIFGIVVRRYENERFAAIRLDDFTGTIDVMAFGDSMSLLKDINECNAVKVLGRIRQGNNGLFILAEGIQKLGFYEEMYKRLEILKCYYGYLKEAQQDIKEEGKEKASSEKAKKPLEEAKKSQDKKKLMLADFVSADELQIERQVIE